MPILTHLPEEILREICAVLKPTAIRDRDGICIEIPKTAGISRLRLVSRTLARIAKPYLYTTLSTTRNNPTRIRQFLRMLHQEPELAGYVESWVLVHEDYYMLDGEVWDDAQDREVWRAEKGGVLGSDDSPARYDRVCALLLLSKLRGLRVLHVDSLDPVTPLNHPDAAVLLLVLPLLESFTWRAGIYGGCELNSLVPIFRAAPNLRSFTGWKCERSTPATAVLGMESITTLTLEFSAVGGDWFEQVLERTSSLKHLCYYEAQEVSQVVGTANVARFSAGLRKVRGSLKTLKIDITHFCLGEQHPPLGPFHDFPRLKVLLIGYHWLVRPGEHRMGLADVLPQGLVYLSMSVCEGPASEECYEDLFVLLSQKEKGRFVKLKCVKIWTDDCNLASRVAVSCESVGMKFWINDQLVRAVGTGSVSSISQ